MRVGTKSILFGAHCFFIHPFFVALAWWKLYSFPLDPRLWVAFFVHDLGYLGKSNMDGPEGEEHVVLGGRIMGVLFGKKWEAFTIGHSRFWAKRVDVDVSRLCMADKLATCLVPKWLYLTSVNLTGEVDEYMALAGTGKYKGEMWPTPSSQSDWHRSMTDYMRNWAYQNAYRKEGE